MSIKRILVATDFSEQADLAFHHAMDIARHTGAELVVMHALSLSLADYEMPYPITVPDAFEERAKELRAEAHKHLEELYEEHVGQGVSLSHVFVDQMPVDGIQTVAKEQKVDLIVLGRHGRGAVASVLLGSVSHGIARQAACDVLIAQGEEPKGAYRRILVPTNFSDLSARALERASELVANGGKVDLLHCWRLPGGPATMWGAVAPTLGQNIMEAGLARGEEWVEKYSKSDATFSLIQEEGDVQHWIDKTLAQTPYDLVVMGFQPRSGLDRLLHGNTAEGTVRHNPVPVYLVR